MKLINKETGNIVVLVDSFMVNDRLFFRLQDEKGVFKVEIKSVASFSKKWEVYYED